MFTVGKSAVSINNLIENKQTNKQTVGKSVVSIHNLIETKQTMSPPRTAMPRIGHLQQLEVDEAGRRGQICRRPKNEMRRNQRVQAPTMPPHGRRNQRCNNNGSAGSAGHRPCHIPSIFVNLQ